MSTIPLTLIEGAIAMPRVRPLRYVPTSFGRDWALLPPARNWRAELKALYAAVLHTFCLTDRAILSLCRWVPLDGRRPSAPAPVPTFDRASINAVEREQDTPAIAAGVVRSTTIEPPMSGATGEGTIRWPALAGGACAIGGVAVLAWIAFGHAERRDPASNLKPANADAAIVSRGSKPEQQSAAETAATQRTFVDDAGASARSTASVPNHVFREQTSAHRDNSNASSEKPVGQRASTRDGAARNVAGHYAARLAASRHHRSQVSGPIIAPRRAPAPSAAGDYSPLAPSALGVDEYASVTLSAATHLRDSRAPARTATSSNPARSGETEWMERISHRRVTDIPEQFSK